MNLIPKDLFSTETRVIKNTALTPEAKRVVDTLARIHGKVRVTQEKKGVHAYIPSPACLDVDGAKELSNLHLAINLDKYLGQGAYAGKGRDKGFLTAAYCMKMKKVYSIADLLQMDPITERGYRDVKTSVFITSLDNEKKLVTDANGKKVPPLAGDLQDLRSLPADHPAVEYLLSRNYDLDILWDMFAVQFCGRELPEGQYERYYRKGPGGWKDTPQNRIMFHCIQDGSTIGWQGRVVEKKHEGWVWFLHPYTGQWDYVKNIETNTVRPDYGEAAWKQISKYKSADAMERNSALYGFDAAIRWNRRMSELHSGWRWFCILNEGPLDAGRLGPPAICATGSFISDQQMGLISRTFSFAYGIFDNDTAGEKAGEYFLRAQGSAVRALEKVPAPYGDLGEMPPEAAALLKTQLTNAIQQTTT